MSKSQMKRYLMSGKEAAEPENILRLFEQIKGRAATDEEKAELYQKAGKTQPPAEPI
jgi:hypothetical protein